MEKLNAMAFKRHDTFWGVQCRSDVGWAGFKSNAGNSDRIVGRLQLFGAGMCDENALQGHARSRQAVSGVQAQRPCIIWFAPLNQGR